MNLLKRLKKIYLDLDKGIFFASLALILFGTFNLVTASSREAAVNLDTSIYYFFYKHIIVLIGCFFIFLCGTHIKTKNYNKFALFIFSLVLGLNILLIVKGVATRGANNWINLGLFKLQPSEIAKPVLIVCLSLLFEKYYKKLSDNTISHKTMLWQIIFVGVCFPFFVFLQKDLGTAIILLGIFAVLFLYSPISRKEKITITGIITVVGCLAAFCFLSIVGYLLSDAQLSRFDYYNPCSKYGTTGYQVCNAFIAINNGGIKGVGLGNSTQKYSYIPEPHTDMVFSIIAEEHGVIGGSIIFLLYLYLLFKVLKLSIRVNRISHKYICLGTATYIFLHILINLGGLFGLIPLTGVPLPFLSYGGSFTISLIGSLTVIQRINIEYRNEKIKL